MLITKQANLRIQSLDEWLQHAPPAKGEKHWKDGRSAKELAKAWMTPNGPKMPLDISDLLTSHPDTTGFQPEWGVPEYETELDLFKGSGGAFLYKIDSKSLRVISGGETTVTPSIHSTAMRMPSMFSLCSRVYSIVVLPY